MVALKSPARGADAPGFETPQSSYERALAKAVHEAHEAQLLVQRSRERTGTLKPSLARMDKDGRGALRMGLGYDGNAIASCATGTDATRKAQPRLALGNSPVVPLRPGALDDAAEAAEDVHVDPALVMGASARGPPRAVEEAPSPPRATTARAAAVASAKQRCAEAEVKAAAAEELLRQRRAEVDAQVAAAITKAIAEASERAGEAEILLAHAQARASDAEARATDAEARATDAEARVRESDTRAADAEARAADAEGTTMDAQARAADAEARARDADARTTDAHARTTDAEARAADAEVRASDAEAKAARTEALTGRVEERLAEAEKRAAEAEKRAVEAEEQRAEAVEQRAEAVELRAEAESRVESAEHMADAAKDELARMRRVAEDATEATRVARPDRADTSSYDELDDKSELISDIWGKRGATYGEKGGNGGVADNAAAAAARCAAERVPCTEYAQESADGGRIWQEGHSPFRWPQPGSRFGNSTARPAPRDWTHGLPLRLAAHAEQAAVGVGLDARELTRVNAAVAAVAERAVAAAVAAAAKEAAQEAAQEAVGRVEEAAEEEDEELVRVSERLELRSGEPPFSPYVAPRFPHMSGINSLFSCRNGLELAFAFDEIVSMGHKENVTLRDIQTHIEMESHEEKLANMIRQSKEREAQETMKLKARSLARESRSSRWRIDPVLPRCHPSFLVDISQR